MARITKRDFITEVSKRANLRKDVVEDVLKAVIDISIEQIVNHGEFVMKDLFSISSKDYKAYSLAGTHVPAQKRLSVRLSEKVKSFWKLKNEVYPEMGDLTRSELEEALKHYNADKLASEPAKLVTKIPEAFPTVIHSGGIPTRSSSSQPQPKSAQIDDDNFNPLLDEED